MVAIKRALISVSDKTGIIDLAKGLCSFGVQIISTGGTAKILSDAGIEIIGVTQVTDFPEMLEGRVKTLHPNIHAAILADRSKPFHMKALEEMSIEPIDMVVINLYPFVETAKKPGVSETEVIENIDIGGPAMIRASAKNFNSVAVVTDPVDYDKIIDELKANRGIISSETRRELAEKAFARTAEYDGEISRYFSGGASNFGDTVHFTYRKIYDLRYGENPHQKGALYRSSAFSDNALVNAEQLHGKELSYNNILDTESAWFLALEWNDPACVIVKHNNPCGVAVKKIQAESFKAALESDPVSAFGGVIAFNSIVEAKTVEEIGGLFLEVIIAPGYEKNALEILKKRKGLRILKLSKEQPEKIIIRNISGGALIQEADIDPDPEELYEAVTSLKPTEKQLGDLSFAMTIAKHVKSNALVIAKDRATVGIGAGQMSRLDSAFIAVRKAGEKAKDAVLASDAFFPFPDALQTCIDAGIAAVIQPGGSVRDKEIIKAAEDADVSMVLTSRRHFKH